LEHYWRTIAVFFVIFFTCNDASAAAGKAKILYVVDGDTISMSYEGRKHRVRLIGIDAPESKANKKAYRDRKKTGENIRTMISQGKEAARFVKGVVRKGDPVSLEFDVEKRDRYGRLLAYIYLSDGRMLNDVIVRSGYAGLLTIPPNVKHAKRFAASYSYARKNRLGLWR
jgi:micrococcal nuclease